MEPHGQNLLNDKVPLSKGINSIQFNALNGKQNHCTDKFKHDDRHSLESSFNGPHVPARVNGLRSRISLEQNCDYSEKSPIFRIDSSDKVPRISKSGNELPNLTMSNITNPNSPLQLRHHNSLRYMRERNLEITPPNSYAGPPMSDTASQISKMYSDTNSLRSWASVGLGSTDGKKMIVRRVPTSPVELFNIVNPPT